jgi:hypothetical protein
MLGILPLADDRRASRARALLWVCARRGVTGRRRRRNARARRVDRRCRRIRSVAHASTRSDGTELGLNASHQAPPRARRRRPRPLSTRPLTSGGRRSLRDDQGCWNRRRRRGKGLRLTLRRRLGCALTDGEQRERVDVPVRLGGQPHAEMNVWLRPFGLAGRADRADDLAFADRGADRKSDRPQVDEGDGVSALGPDRQAEPFVRQPPGEGDDPRRRSAHIGSRRRPDVDAAMLTARVRIALGDERPEHRPLDGPGPRGRARGMSERNKDHRPQDD